MSSIFTKIIDGELPGHFVWKDEICVALMTIAPIRAGHLLVIPREEIDHWDDLPEQTATHMMTVAQKIAKALKQTHPAARVGMMIAGLEVPHTHIHLIPLDSMEDMDFSRAEMSDPEPLAEAASQIRSELNAQGHSEAQV